MRIVRAVVVEMTMGDGGQIRTAELYLATVRNHAKLAYPSLGAWLDGGAPPPPKLRAVQGLEDNLRMQDAAARARRSRGIGVAR